MKCIYCGNDANTKDHIPPRNIFPKNIRQKLISVPSCLACNRGSSADDEFFRMFVTGFSSEHSSIAKNIFEGEIKRAAKERPALVRAFLGKMKPLVIKSPAGLYLGEAIGTRFASEDWDRFFKVSSNCSWSLLRKIHRNRPTGLRSKSNVL